MILEPVILDLESWNLTYDIQDWLKLEILGFIRLKILIKFARESKLKSQNHGSSHPIFV